MKVLRRITTICPVCLQVIEGCLLQKKDVVTLYRNCSIDGDTEAILSYNHEHYAELDRFYFKVLKRGFPRGKITNCWILSTSKCQMKCNYCQVNIQEPFFQDMDRADFDRIIHEEKSAKLSLSGGEPTLHNDIFYFFEKARGSGRCTQLATNGLNIANSDFYQRLKKSHVKEIRFSFETLTPISEQSKIHEFNKYLDIKLAALKHLERGEFYVSLSPTIFKGINENLLMQTLNYAKNRFFVKEISVNGFSWAGHGMTRDKSEMIMPDEMMDIICNEFGIKDREDIFIFQKVLFILLQLLNIRICMYTQIMIFLRRNDKLEPITDYFNMNRVKKALGFWERFSKMHYITQWLTFCLVIAYSIKPGILLFLKDILQMILVNMIRIDFSRYPNKLLPLVLNTNCSTLTADEELIRQCMSAVIYKESGRLKRTFTAHILLKNKFEYLRP
jgi:MoaA/NifB/PqqE/SkfB family radical SAM enzyme